MSKVEIVNTEGGGHSYGTIVRLDGQELQKVRRVEMVADVDDLLRVKADLLADEDFSLSVDASVSVSVIPIDASFEIEELVSPGGTKRYRAVERRPSLRVGWSADVTDAAHMASPGRHREYRGQRRRQVVEIDLPVWLSSVCEKLGEWTHKLLGVRA